MMSRFSILNIILFSIFGAILSEFDIPFDKLVLLILLVIAIQLNTVYNDLRNRS
jgi:hypothetical protein